MLELEKEKVMLTQQLHELTNQYGLAKVRMCDGCITGSQQPISFDSLAFVFFVHSSHGCIAMAGWVVMCGGVIG